MRSFFAAAFLWLLFTPLGVFCLAWAFLFARCAEYPSALVALGFAAFTLGLAAMLGIVATGRVEPRVSIIDGGMTVRPDRRVDGLLFGSTIGAFLGMATYAIGVPMGMIDITVPSGDEKYFVIACAMAVPVGAVSLIQIIRRRGTSYVRMTVDGLELGNAMTSVQRSWDEVVEVADRQPEARGSTGTTYVKTADRHSRVVPTDWYTPRGHALRALMHFYWQHPEVRGELADRRAIERLTLH